MIPDIWLPSKQRATSGTMANKRMTGGTNCFGRSVRLSLVIHSPQYCYRRRGGAVDKGCEVNAMAMSRAKRVWCLVANITRHQPQSKKRNAIRNPFLPLSKPNNWQWPTQYYEPSLIRYLDGPYIVPIYPPCACMHGRKNKPTYVTSQNIILGCTSSRRRGSHRGWVADVLDEE